MWPWLFVSSHLFGCAGDPCQAAQGGAREDLADVVQCDDQFLEPVKGGVFFPVQQDAAVLLRADGAAREFDLIVLGAEQGLDGGVQSQGEGGQFRSGERSLAALWR
jgi:hypothetical protein